MMMMMQQHMSPQPMQAPMMMMQQQPGSTVVVQTPAGPMMMQQPQQTMLSPMVMQQPLMFAMSPVSVNMPSVMFPGAGGGGSIAITSSALPTASALPPTTVLFPTSTPSAAPAPALAHGAATGSSFVVAASPDPAALLSQPVPMASPWEAPGLALTARSVASVTGPVSTAPGLGAANTSVREASGPGIAPGGPRPQATTSAPSTPGMLFGGLEFGSGRPKPVMSTPTPQVGWCNRAHNHKAVAPCVASGVYVFMLFVCFGGRDVCGVSRHCAPWHLLPSLETRMVPWMRSLPTLLHVTPYSEEGRYP